MPYLTLIEAREEDTAYHDTYASTSRDFTLTDGWLREALARDDLDFTAAWDLFTGAWHHPATQRDAFREYVQLLAPAGETIGAIAFCGNCEYPCWQIDLDNNGVTTLYGTRCCEWCRNDSLSYCDSCDGWYTDGDDYLHNHDEDDDEDDEDGDPCCSSSQPQFTIRDNGGEPLANDTLITVPLAAGTISETGMNEIYHCLSELASAAWSDGNREDYVKLAALSGDLPDNVGPAWQLRTGNFPKRLSARAYKEYGIKLTPDILSRIGVIARNHSKGADYRIAVTRRLNMGSREFYNEGSCWWGSSYGVSRCALKTNGGFALRSFDADGDVTGRAWVMPLRQDLSGGLNPTFNTRTPDAFVVFNGYGELDGYAPARIMAHLAGWTYKRIGFECDPMYVNAGGYLIAPEDIVQRFGELNLSVRRHSRLYQQEQEAETGAKDKKEELADVA